MTDFDVGKLMFDLQEAIEAVGAIPANMLSTADISQMYTSGYVLTVLADNARTINEYKMGTVQ